MTISELRFLCIDIVAIHWKSKAKQRQNNLWNAKKW